MFEDGRTVQSLEFDCDTKQRSVCFSKLTKFTCNQILDFDHDSLDNLLKGPDLKAVYLNVGELEYLNAIFNPKSIRPLEHLFNYLTNMQYKGQIRRDIQVYIHNVLIESTSRFRPIGFYCSFSDLYERHPPKAPLPSFIHVDYAQHSIVYNDRSCVKLRHYFRNIQAIYIHLHHDKEMIDIPDFSLFLRSCNGLRKLVCLINLWPHSASTESLVLFFWFRSLI